MKLPVLKLLFQAYLTVDWPEDYADVRAAINDFVANEPAAVGIDAELAELLDSTADDEVLRRRVVEELGSGYLPDVEGLSMREWLETVRRWVGPPLTQ